MHMSPRSVHNTALVSDIAATHVKVASSSTPRRQLRPTSVFEPGLDGMVLSPRLISGRNFCFDGEGGVIGSGLHTFTCLVPTLMTTDPNQAISWMDEVHLLLAYNFGAPVFGLIDQM